MVFGSQNVSQDQVQQWIAQNPQLAQAITQAMTSPQPRYTPVTQNNQNWGAGRNSFMPNANSAQPSVPMLYGRVISTPQEIRPNEIPMDGSASLFPMSDDSCIYAKAWKPDGGIDTIRYIREDKTENGQEAQSPEFIQVMARLERIEKMLDQRTQHRQQNYNNRNARQDQMSTREYVDASNKTEAVNNG